MSQKDPIILLGAGLAGSLMAAYLAQKGFEVHVYERRPDMRQANMSAGKSINLALSVRGINALREVGILDEIMEIAIPMRGRMMHDLEGNLTYQPYSKDGTTAINSVSRGDLNRKLMDLADQHDNIHLYFNWRCKGMNFRTGDVIMKNEETGEEKRLKGETVIGADGAFSGLRGSMVKTPRFNYSQDYLTHSYKELEIPANPDGTHKLDKNCLHIWPRGTYMLIGLPNLDGSFTMTLFLAHEGEKNSFESLQTPEQVQAFFEEQFPDAVPLMPDLVQDYFDNPVGSLVTVRCRPYSVGGQAVLVGDSAHAVVPFFGQGMNAAFEDCTALAAAIDQHGTDWAKVFEAYQEKQIDNGHAIATMAIENYYEMRDYVGDERWLFRKSVEHWLEKTFPGRYISRYEMVSFTRVPYSEAYRLGALNDIILDTLIEGVDSIDQIDPAKADALIKEHLGK